MSTVAGGRPVDLSARRLYHRAPMPPPDDRQRVLIVEDEPNIASFARMYLEAAGFDVSLAARGDDGLRMAEAEPPDLIILDLMLPGIDGLEVRSASARAADADHHAHGARRRGRQGRRPGARRRRLHHQAVQPARAGRARPGRAAPRREPAGGGRPAPADHHRGGPRCASRSGGREVFVGGRGRRAHAQGVRPPGDAHREPRARAHARAAPRAGLGLHLPRATAAPSTSTCASCGASSATPARSRPCGAPATRSPPSGDLGGAMADPPGPPGARGRRRPVHRRHRVRGGRRRA